MKIFQGASALVRVGMFTVVIVGCGSKQPADAPPQRAAPDWDGFVASCEGGTGKACQLLGANYERARRGASAREWFQKGCALKYGYSCSSLARGEKDDELRQTLMKRACEFGDAITCEEIGAHFLHSGDKAKAATFFFLGCTHDPHQENTHACEAAGELDKGLKR